jgi:hypothetical protein
MKFCESVIKEKLDFTEQIYKCAKHGTRRKAELSKMIADYEEVYDYLTGKIEAVSFVPDYSLRELRRQFNWLNYDKELHADTINELNECINKMIEDGTKGLSNQYSEQGG